MRTLGDIVSAVEVDMDLQLSSAYSQSLVNRETVVRYINEGLRELSKSLIHQKEDYFLTFHDIEV